MKELQLAIERVEQMIRYNLKKKASAHSLARLRAERAGLLKLYKDAELLSALEWHDVYMEDKMRRGAGGGASEADANARTSMKQLMKDNRAQQTKQTVEQREAYYAELTKFEDEFGKLEKLNRSPLTRSDIDSYTGEPIKD